MKRKSLKGVAIMEFALSMLVMVPLLLGTIGCGLQIIQSMQTIQLARDAARIYGQNVDMSLPGSRIILAGLGANVGLHTAAGDTGGSAVLILTKVRYMDRTICPNGLADCANFQQWVFAQRLTFGNTSYRTSSLGSPLTNADPRWAAVAVDAKGNISNADQQNNGNDVARFSNAGNPFVTVAGVLNNLPSGTFLCISEAASQGFTMPPFASGGMMYSYNVF